ncbi:MAG: response regulator [Betaproteobacteria bacterium]|nr:response regulator [Betaproteobacteria bacterium]
MRMPSVDPVTGGERAVHARTALVVDDDPSARLLLESLLVRSGYQVAVDGLEAVAQFAAHRASIVFMDMHMPTMDGLEAAKRIKALAGSEFVPVIFVSGAGDTADLVRSIDAGGDDFLVKPVDERAARGPHGDGQLQRRHLSRRVLSIGRSQRAARRLHRPRTCGCIGGNAHGGDLPLDDREGLCAPADSAGDESQARGAAPHRQIPRGRLRSGEPLARSHLGRQLRHAGCPRTGRRWHSGALALIEPAVGDSGRARPGRLHAAGRGCAE